MKKKLIESYRVRNDRAEALREVGFKLSMQLGDYVLEPQIISFLIDSCAQAIVIDGDDIYLDVTKLANKKKQGRVMKSELSKAKQQG